VNLRAVQKSPELPLSKCTRPSGLVEAVGRIADEDARTRIAGCRKRSKAGRPPCESACMRVSVSSCTVYGIEEEPGDDGRKRCAPRVLAGV